MRFRVLHFVTGFQALFGQPALVQRTGAPGPSPCPVALLARLGIGPAPVSAPGRAGYVSALRQGLATQDQALASISLGALWMALPFLYQTLCKAYQA